MTLLITMLLAGLAIFWFQTRPKPIGRQRAAPHRVVPPAAAHSRSPDDDDDFLRELGQRLRKPPADNAD